jgi:hypothetical protein
MKLGPETNQSVRKGADAGPTVLGVLPPKFREAVPVPLHRSRHPKAGDGSQVTTLAFDRTLEPALFAYEGRGRSSEIDQGSVSSRCRDAENARTRVQTDHSAAEGQPLVLKWPTWADELRKEALPPSDASPHDPDPLEEGWARRCGTRGGCHDHDGIVSSARCRDKPPPARVHGSRTHHGTFYAPSTVLKTEGLTGAPALSCEFSGELAVRV